MTVMIPAWVNGKLQPVEKLEAHLKGLKDTLPVYRDTIEYRADVGGGLIEHEIVDLFVIHVEEKPNVNLNPDEVMDVRWIDYHALQAEVSRSPEKFTPWVRIYVKEHASRIFDRYLFSNSDA